MQRQHDRPEDDGSLQSARHQFAQLAVRARRPRAQSAEQNPAQNQPGGDNAAKSRTGAMRRSGSPGSCFRHGAFRVIIFFLVVV